MSGPGDRMAAREGDHLVALSSSSLAALHREAIRRPQRVGAGPGRSRAVRMCRPARLRRPRPPASLTTSPHRLSASGRRSASRLPVRRACAYSTGGAAGRPHFGDPRDVAGQSDQQLVSDSASVRLSASPPALGRARRAKRGRRRARSTRCESEQPRPVSVAAADRHQPVGEEEAGVGASPGSASDPAKLVAPR